MELLEFYRALLPAAGHYALFSVPRTKHVWAESLDELVALTNTDEAGWYFATAAFDRESRKQEFVTAKRCLYFDVDAGAEKFARDPDGVYETQREATAAVLAFTKSTGLTPSMLVSSGAGLHLYYALDADLSHGDWLPLAKALGATARAAGLRVDASCTTDSARVLRPLGALHKNGSRVRLLKATGLVWSAADLRALTQAPEPELAAPARAKLKVNDALQMFEPAPSSAFKAAERCPALREVAEVRGDVPEPHWRAMLGVVKFSVEGVDAAHEWSSGHPEYDPDQTETKFRRYEGTGPTTCETFSRHTRACQTCEHRGKITTPLQLGRMTVDQVEALPEDKRPVAPTPAPVPPTLPFSGIFMGEGYKIVEHDGRWHLQARKTVEKETDEGVERNHVWIRFCDEVCWIDGWTEAGRQEADGAMANLHLYTNSERKHTIYELPTKNLSSASDLFKWLADKGITRSTIDPTSSVIMHNYVNSQFNHARAVAARLALRSRFGLQFDGDGPASNLICAHGRYILRADGTIEEAVLNQRLVGYRNVFCIADLPPSNGGRWPGTVWTEHIMPGASSQVDFYRKYYGKEGYEVAQLAVMMSLASPLLVFAADTQLQPGHQLPSVGLTVSLYSSSSGQGKTAMQKAVASAYGDPAHLVLSGSNQDATPVYQSAHAAVLGTMPYFLDEVTGNTPAEVGALINRLANGSDRRRADRNGAPRDVSTWALVGSVSTNIPQREMLAAFQKSSDALQMRLIELTCEFPKIELGRHVDFERDRDTMLAPHYGALGAVISLLVLRNGVEKMRGLVQSRMSEAALLIPGSTQRERFMQRGMAVVLACHDALSQVSLAPFDRQVLIQQYCLAAREAVEFARSINRSPDEMLRKMVSDMAPFIIVTQNESHIRQDSRFDLVTNRQQLRSPYLGRRIETGRYLYLLVDAMKDWCQEQQISYGELVSYARKNGFFRRLEADLAATPKRVKITKGTDLSAVHGHCFVIDENRLFYDEDAANSDLANVVDMYYSNKENRDGENSRPERSTR